MKKKPIAFYCFSPLVMLSTFTIEFALVFYVLARYKLTTTTKLVALLLFNLGIFQLVEYLICAQNQQNIAWTRTGYVAITLLPALGLHLAQTLAKKRFNWGTVISYTAAAVFSVLFMFFPAFEGFACRSNYAIFNLVDTIGVFYSVYYYALLFVGVGTCLLNIKLSNAPRKTTLKWLVIGYLSFIIPTSLVNLFLPQTTEGYPSILCGFAVLFAFILTFKVLPNVAEQRTS